MNCKCTQCGKTMSPMEAIGGAVCMACARKNHAKATGSRTKVVLTNG